MKTSAEHQLTWAIQGVLPGGPASRTHIGAGWGGL